MILKKKLNQIQLFMKLSLSLIIFKYKICSYTCIRLYDIYLHLKWFADKSYLLCVANSILINKIFKAVVFFSIIKYLLSTWDVLHKQQKSAKIKIDLKLSPWL